ncbi:helix-turn-helix transcriptional regulator [Carboxylicivirga sediminis]|uniref:Helix-turn-helix transcriptional regulator n=1 Tax=Carboxylicivirga sediminis TaxID=2006564 RepID=A0A941IYJ6_9BACT|nr:helix-turn-helix transcriptional regulator [Carboxylicivirga sediminis]MBR8536653.1 helix-turn-helix transcriptional regulator [Carboxylicivirga sediminis]
MYTISSTPDSVSKELASRHKALRKQLKLTQAELADRAGVSLGSLKRFETSGQISLESLLKLANLLNRLSDFDSIFTLREDKKDLERLFTTKP